MNLKIFFLFAFLFFLPLASAAAMDMKTNFSQDETLLSKVSGNFYEPIEQENIFLYRGHVRIPIESHVREINGDFYIYAQLLGKSPDNYSLSVENVRYYDKFELTDEPIVKNFTITENFADFLILQGFVVTGGNFSVEAVNLADNEISVVSKIKTEEESKGFFASLFGKSEEETLTKIKSGETKEIIFEINDLNETKLIVVELGTENTKYEIPVYLIGKEKENVENKELSRDMEFEPSYLNLTIPIGSNATRILYLNNIGETDLENITLSISSILKSFATLSIESIEKLETNSSVKIKIDFISEDSEGIVEGQVKAKTGDNLYVYATIFLNSVASFLPDEKTENESGTTPETPSPNTCSDFNGTVCSENQQCSGEIKYASDGVCCLGVCGTAEKSQTGKIIGWGIIIFLIFLTAWFFLRRYKSVQRNIDLLKIAGRR